MSDLFFLRLDDCAASCDAVDTAAFVRDLRTMDDVERREVADMVTPWALPVVVGQTYRVKMPYSECAMHMRIAGQYRDVLVREHGVRLGDEHGPHMTDGEAGILWSEERGRYFYVV